MPANPYVIKQLRPENLVLMKGLLNTFGEAFDKLETASGALLFLDYMKEHPEEIRRYEELKHRLMEQHTTYRDSYTRGKKNYIEKIIARAKS